MATSTELSRSRFGSSDGTSTVVVLDRVSPDRICLMLVKGAYASRYSGVPDGTAVVSRDVKDLLTSPTSED